MTGSISGSNLAIGISLVLRNKFSGGVKTAIASLDELEAKTQRMAKQQMAMQRDMNAVGAGIGLMAIRGMANWTKIGAGFGYTMDYVSTIADKKGGVGFDKLSQRAKLLGADTMFTARQVADGMKYMGMAGMNTEEIYNNISAAVSLAGATMERLEGKGGTADIMTNVMKGFNISSTEKNAMRVADVLTTAVTGANTNLWDFHEGLKYAVSTARTLGVSLEETSSLLMIMGDAGIQGSMAGTAIENMLRYTVRAMNEAKLNKGGKALQLLGLSPKDLKDTQGRLMGISPVLKTIGSRLSAMDDITKYNTSADIFGVRGNRAAMLAMADGLESFDKALERLNNNATGRATNNLKTMMGTLMGTGMELSSSWETFQITFTESVEPILIPVLSILTQTIKVLNRLASTPLGSFLTKLAAGFIVVKTVTMGYRAVVLSLRLLHLNMGASFTGSAAKVVAGYNSMTSAAGRFAAVSGVGMAAGGKYGAMAARAGIGNFVGTASNGAKYKLGRGGTSTFVSRNTPTGWSLGRQTKFGNFMGKASPWAMLGGMGLSMAGESMVDEGGEKTGWGKGLSVAGDAIGWAGTGAMLGSIVPGLGTTIGAVVGGVGGLLYGLYNELESVSDIVDNATKEKPTTNIEKWAEKAKKLQEMKFLDTIFGAGFTPDVNSMWATDKAGANAWLQNGQQFTPDPNRITINIDGKRAFDETINKKQYEALIDLGLF